ncbi:MAG TPA: DEAD/DEAH box helicase [Pirellulaceae bacterium]|nr:DEAD/DEAH box helicase [Pirellulaceae bacterium]
MNFQDLELAEPIQRALADENYTTPTPIQAMSIPHLLAGRDLLGCAQTGTGKTAAFALPILQRLFDQRQRATPRSPTVLVLSPTRELAVQIADSFSCYGRHVHFRMTTVFGGVGQGPQVRALTNGVHVVVATPGRLLDLIEQGYLKLDKVEVFVLDEADRMFDMGFLPDIKRIIAKLPAKRQSLFFSATMPDKIAELASSLLHDPVRVEITPQSTTVERIEQKVLFVKQSDKTSLLIDVLGKVQYDRCLVFTRTKHGADKVAKHLCQQGMLADAIHGNKSQNARQRTLNSFKQGKIRILVATDVAARGIDVDGVSHVFNYDIPHEAECYVHRIGRTGRAGASGIAIAFCDHEERGSWRAIEKLVRRPIDVDADHDYHVSAPASKPRTGGARPGGAGQHAKRPFRAPSRGKGFTSGKAKGPLSGQGRRGDKRQFV